jgi:hypothetical protein
MHSSSGKVRFRQIYAHCSIPQSVLARANEVIQ